MDEDEEDQKPTLTPAEVEIYRQRSETFVLGSQIIFYKNGQPQGVAYTDLLRSTYMPTVSLYMGAAVEVNFGPYYAIPPPDLLQADLSHCGLYPLYSDSHTTIKKNPVILPTRSAYSRSTMASPNGSGETSSFVMAAELICACSDRIAPAHCAC